METYVTLYKPFLSGIYQDICDLYPEEISSHTKLGCENIIELLKVQDVIQLCKIGKMIEKSFITGKRLPIEEFPTQFSSEAVKSIFYNEDGFPRLLENCFERLFRKDGTLTYWSEDTLGIVEPSNEEYRELCFPASKEHSFHVHNQFTALLGTKTAESYALAMLCLRQLFLGCSKLRSWECLRRRVFGDTIFQTSGYHTFTDKCKFFNSLHGETSSLRYLFIRGFRFVCTVH